jgi:hypothetical protein
MTTEITNKIGQINIKKSIKELTEEGWADTFSQFAHLEVYANGDKRLIYDPAKQTIERIYSEKKQK